jgi:hypothetical protein
MIFQDDDNHVMNAFWLPPEAPLLLILPPLRRKRSESVSRLIRTNRTVIPIWGQVAGASSDNPELLAKCPNGTLDASGAECEPAFWNIKYQIDQESLAGEIANTV